MSAAIIGGTSLSAGLADSQAQLDQALGVATSFSSDSVAQYAAAYRASAGGPTLSLLGFNPFQITATGSFHAVYWGAIIVFLGVMAIIAMQHVLNGRYSIRGRHPLNGLVQIYLRLLFGVLLISNLPLVYGTLMTVNRALTDAVQSMGSQAMSTLLQTGSSGTLALGAARAEAIRAGAARRTIALYPNGAGRSEMIQIGSWYNAAAFSVNARLAASSLSATLPLLDASRWNDASTPDDQITASIGRAVVQNFGALVGALGALPMEGGPLSISFPAGTSAALPLLSAALASDDQAAAQAISLPAVPASAAQFEADRTLYSKNVQAHTLDYLDAQVLPILGAAPSLAQRAKAWFAESVEHAAVAATGGLVGTLRGVVDWVGRGIGVVLTRIVAFVFTAGASALIEIELFLLVLAMPLWLLPATEEAFHGVLRSLGSLALAVPAYQFLMLFVDALMGLVLKYLCFGPLAAGAGAGATTGGVAYSAAAAIAIVGSGGEIIALATVCYLLAYIFLAVYFAFRTPRIVGAFMKGAGTAGEFISSFVTGLASGAAVAWTTASVAAGGAGLAGRWLAAAGAPSAAGTSPPVFSAPPAGPFTAQRFAARASGAVAGGPAPVAQTAAASPAPATAWSETAGFGFRTFIDCLGAKSPVDGISTALDALEDHRKQKAKEAEARHKADQAAAKAAAPKKRATR